jgi:hypothetical protein
MPEKYDCQVELGKRQMTNETIDVLNIVLKKDEKNSAALSYRLNLEYEEYAKCGNLGTVVSCMAQDAAEAIDKNIGILKQADIEKISGQVIMVLINTRQNEELLKNVPHREWHDLSVVYRWQLGIGEASLHDALIGHELAAAAGMDEADLYAAAEKNMQKMFPPTVEGMAQVIKRIAAMSGMPEEPAYMLGSAKSDNRLMYVISNGRNYYGAASILFENVVHGLAERLDCSLDLLPASIHEFIAVPAIHNVNGLVQMVREINAAHVSFNERLSNHVYLYDKGSETISMVTDVPYKRLDG